MKYPRFRFAAAALVVTDVTSLALAQRTASRIGQPLLREDAMTPYLIVWEIAWIAGGLAALTYVVLILLKKLRFDPWFFAFLVLGILTCLWLGHLPSISSGA